MTIQRLAHEMGFSQPALYRHFRNKTEILLALMDRLEQMLLQPIVAIAGDSGRSVASRLRAILAHHLQLIADHDSLPILLLAEASSSEEPRLTARMRTILEHYLGVLEELVSEGQEAGHLSATLPPDALGTLLLGAPAIIAIRHRLMPGDALSEQAWMEIVDFLLNRLGPTEDAA